MGIAHNLSTDSLRELPFGAVNRRPKEKGGRSRPEWVPGEGEPLPA
jgi:hypothetical protein